MPSRSILGALLGVGVFALSCSDSPAPGRDAGAGVTPVLGGVVTGHIASVLSPETGISTVTVRLGSATVTTNEQGWYVFSGVAAADDLVLGASATGYIEASRAVSVQDGTAIHIDIILVPVGSTGTVPGAAGGTIQVTGGGQVTFPANAFVTSTGAAVTGDVSVRVSTLDPSTEDGFRAFPGQFVGTATDGSVGSLESFGLFAIEARQGEALLNLRSGVSAAVVTAIPASVAARAPATVPLWSLNTATGLWREEATATREMGTSGPEYRASVPHLSWWNYDLQYRTDTTCIRPCYVGAAGPVRGVHLVVRGLDFTGGVEGFTGADGCVDLNIKRSARVRVTPDYNGQQGSPVEVTTQDIQTNRALRPNQCQALGPYTLEPMRAQMILTWGTSPRDLDSHLTGPSADASGRFHVYYASRGSVTASPFANLDTDDTSGLGPEVVTITRVSAGRYRYAVHNYTGQTGTGIEASGATVVMVVPGLGYLQRFAVPTANPANGNVWRVADLVSNGTQVTGVEVINDFANTSAGAGVYNP